MPRTNGSLLLFWVELLCFTSGPTELVVAVLEVVVVGFILVIVEPVLAVVEREIMSDVVEVIGLAELVVFSTVLEMVVEEVFEVVVVELDVWDHVDVEVEPVVVSLVELGRDCVLVADVELGK